MAAVAGYLIGRESELAVLDAALDETAGGRFRVVELAGEPGIGKTRLLQEFAGSAEARGSLVLVGSASELEHDLPFSVFVDALDRYLGELNQQFFAGFDEPAQAELGHVFPALRGLARRGKVALQHERHRSHQAVCELIQLLAADKPLALILDDFHWADSASIELLASLLRRHPPARVLICVALRPRQTPDRLIAPLERAQREGTLVRFELGAFNAAEARAFVGPDLDAAMSATLYEESGGNPFYLLQLVRAMDASERAALEAADLSATIGVPRAVAAALTEEIDTLSEGARQLLQGAAVAGDPFEPELAAAAARMSEDVAMDALDDLLRVDLVRPTDMARHFRFRHPLLRRAVYETTPAGWRLSAHERCANLLSVRGASATARAYHVERSARAGDIEAVALLAQAGEAAARLAPASAARWFTAALRLTPEKTPIEVLVELRLARARCRAAAGQLAEGRADLIETLRLVPHGNEHRARVATACASIEHLLGLHSDAHRHLANALAELGSSGSADAIGLMLELSADGLYAGDFEAMRTWSDRALAAAVDLGDQVLIAAARSIGAFAFALIGDVRNGLRSCDVTTALVDDLADDELARRLDALAHLASAELYLDRFQAAARHARRGLDIGRATGQDDLFPFLTAMLGGSLWVLGRPHESGEIFDGAVESARLTENIQGIAWGLFNRSFAALVEGDVELALATATESVELAEQMEAGTLPHMAAATLATVLLEAGEAERAVDMILTHAGGAELRPIGGGWRARFLEVLTHALLATERRTEAQQAALTAHECADTVRLPTAAAHAELASAALDLDAGQPVQATEKALRAAENFESVAALWDAARARELAGRALARAGERSSATAQLELAAAAFESFGSLRYRDRADRELRRLGQRIHRRSQRSTGGSVGIASLTEREMEVARLVVDRKTNAQIAQELFLSEKTVETHLRNMFNKLDVGTRVALAQAVERAVR